jgi:hypothetical protein
VDQALVIGSGGRLIPWIPLVDAHGVDRAYSWDGIEAANFAQIKTSGFADAEGRHRWDLRAGSFASYPQFSVVLSASASPPLRAAVTRSPPSSSCKAVSFTCRSPRWS